MFFNSWSEIGRVVAVSAISFILIVTILRIVGQQALAKMSGFDVVFTVTFGSIIANMTVDRKVTLAAGLAALITMLALQEIIRRLQSRYLRFHHMVRELPRVVLWEGMLLDDRLQHTGISGDEVRAAVRKAGIGSLSEVLIVVLENDGEWSVIRKADRKSDETALLGLPIPGRPNARSESKHQTATFAPPTRIP